MNVLSSQLISNLLRSIDLRAIAAMTQDHVIGNNGKIPWAIPEELSYFRKMTDGATVIVGRKTFESIGHPLINRRNIVVTQSHDFNVPGIEIIHDIKKLLQMNIIGPAWVCGGAQIYKLLLPACRELYISTVYGDYSGDTFFPQFDDLFCEESIVHKTDRFIAKKYRNTSY